MREDVQFAVADGTVLRGWWYRPRSDRPWPAVVLSHGFGAVREMYLDTIAQAFVEVGLGCLVYDHRCCGASDGEPRGELDPFLQVSDLRDAVTFVLTLEGVDAQRVGLWGTSYSGGHVLVVAATDRRVRCVVSQVPTISGRRNTLRRFPGAALAEARERWAADRARRMQGQAPTTVPIVPTLAPEDIGRDEGADPTQTIAGNDFAGWIRGTAPARLGAWRNEMTLRSQELYAAYEPGVHVEAVSPTPLLVIATTGDEVTPTDEILAAYARALEPKRLCLVPGGHFDVYGVHRAKAVAAAREWFIEHI